MTGHVMILLDTSGSTARYIGLYLTLVNRVLEKRFEKDLFSIATFSDALRFIHVRSFVREPLRPEDISSKGSTALYDNLGVFLRKLQNFEEKLEITSGKRTVIVITDGLDTNSQFLRVHDVETQVKLLRDRGWEFLFLGVCPISMGTAGELGFPHRILYEQTPQSLEAVTDRILKFLETFDPVADLDLRFGNMSIS